MRKSILNEETALKLYHEHKTDTEIGKALGKSHDSIYKWRKRNNLASLNSESVDYREVLTPKQSEEMHRFLKCLSNAAKKALKDGIKLDINAAINAWRS